MSILPNQTSLNPTFQFYAGGYTATGGMSSNNTFSAGDLPIPVSATCNIFNFNSNLMPEIGKSYLVSVNVGVQGMTGAGTGANAFVNVGLQYGSGVINNSAVAQAIPNPGVAIGLVTLTDIFQRVANPTVPLRLILGNNTGSNITAGNLRITAVNVMEVPNPVNLVDSNIQA